MSTTVDQRVVEMRFDNKHFENNVQTSMSTLDKFKQSLNLTGVSKGLDAVSVAANNCNMSGLSSAADTVQAKFSALGVMGVTALANITNSALNAGKKIVSALTIDPMKTGFQEYETQINAVQTILANTASKGTTLNQVNAALDELNTYADKTIYNFTEMTRNIGTFTAAGVDLKTSVEAIKGIANLAAISGSNAQQASTAMYQLSQALSSGTVKLMDWNSVVNAGMGGQVFQDSLKETARVHGIAIDDMIKSEGSFRETLKDGWLSSEILTETLAKFTGDLTEAQLESMGYTKEQISEIMKLGKMANDAAQKVKTFTQLMDTLKEAAQSGWSQSWKIIVGDFEEAKALWTEVSDVLGKIIGDSADARNEMLSGGLSSGWDQFLRKGIADETGYIDAIKEVAKEHNVEVDNLIKDGESFESTLKQGWLTSDIMSQSLEKLTAKTRGLSDEELTSLGYTRKMVDELEALNESVQNGTLSVEEFTKKMTITSGRENLITAFRNSFDGLLNVIKPISEAFREIFPPYTAEQLYALTEKIRDLTANFKLSDETSDNLKRTFKGLFAVLDIAKQAFTAVFNAITPLFGGVGDLAGGILSVTANWGDWLVKLRDTVETTDVFNNVMQGVVGFIKAAKDAVGDFIKTVKEKIVFPGFELLHSFLERVRERMSGVGEAAGKMKSGVTTAVDAMGSALSKNNFLQALKSLWDGMTTVVGGIIGLLGELGSGFAKVVGDINFDSVFDIISGLSLGGIAIAIVKFLKSVREPLESFTDILDGVRGCFEAYQTQLKAGALLKIAGAIGILTASILVISLIDSDKLAASLGAITVLFADLMVSMSLFGKISGNLTGVFKTCTAMISISVAVLILASALKKIGELKFDQMVTGLVGVVGLTATMVAAAKIMGNGSSTIIKGATQMVIFAAAIKILASACADLSKLNWDQLKIGLVGVGVLLGEVALFMNFAKFSGKTITTATGIVILSAAIKILASACSDFGKMKWDDIDKGLVAIGVLLAEIAIFTNLTGNAKHVISTGIALIAIGAAMKILASALKDFGTMPWDEIGRGLAAMAGALLAITLAVTFMPKNMIGVGVGLIAVSTALVILATALGKMGDMQWDEIGRGLTVLGGAMAILAIGLKVMTGTLAGSAAMLVAAAALAILTPVLSTLGAMSWESIVKGLVSIAGAFAIIGVAGLVLTPLVPAILALSGAFALIGLGVLGMGAGLLIAGAGLSAVALGFTALATAGAAGATAIAAALVIIISGIASLIPAIMEEIGKGLIVLCQVVADGAPAIGEAFKAVILTLVDVIVECIPAIADGVLKLVAGVLAALVEYTPQIVDSVFQFLIAILDGVARNLPELIGAAVDVLMSFLSGVVDAFGEIDVDTLLKGLVGIGLLTGVMAALAAVAALAPGAMLGVLGMGVVIAELALVLAAIGALAQIPGLTWLIGEGGKLLEGIGSAIGGFIGGIVGGFMSGVSSSFPKIATDLSMFMSNIQPFVDGAKNIDASAMDGVSALAGAILILTAANIINGLTSWFTGGSSVTKFASDLVPFGYAMKEFSVAVDGMNGDAVVNAATAGKILAEMAATLPNTGGVAGFFAGENDMTTFGNQIVPFGKAMKDFSLAVDGMNGDAVVNAATAGRALAEMAATLPNTGGVVGWFTGENDMGVFGSHLVSFGRAIKAFSLEVDGLSVEAITNSATAGHALVELANTLPNTGGVIDFFTGGNDIGAFGQSLILFGANFATYSGHMKNVDSGIVTATANAASSIVELQNSLPKTGGWFSDEMSLADFGSDMSLFGYYFGNYYSHISGISVAQLSGIIGEINNLVAMAKGMSGLDTSVMETFGDALTTLGKSGVDGFIAAFTDATERVSSAAINMLQTFVKGLDAGRTTLMSSVVSLVSEAVAGMSSKYYDFYDAAAYLVRGFANGISDNMYLAAAKSRAMAAAAAQAAKDELDEHSPSKVGYKIGDFFGVAFVNAIASYIKRAYRASSDMAYSAKKGLTNAIGKIKDVMSADMDIQPTIRPVLDLGNVRAGAGSIESMLGMGTSIGVLATAGSIGYMMNTRAQNRATSEVVSAINKLRNELHSVGNTSYTVNGVTYDDSGSVSEAVKALVKAAIRERRV